MPSTSTAVLPAPTGDTADPNRRYPWRTLMWVMPVTVVVWVFVALRAVPDVRSWDRGVFVSVAERLVAGDRLYVDVWDNKEPLFYYVTAVGRWVSPWADIVIELGWLVAAAFSVYLLARWAGAGVVGAFLAGPVATPAVIVTTFYYPGYSHLPGTTVTVLMLAAAVRGRTVLAGVLLGLLLFLKVLVLPVAAIALLTVLWGRSARTWVTAAAGVAAAVGGVVALMAVRGELGGYWATLQANAEYATEATGLGGLWVPQANWILVVIGVSVVVSVLSTASRRLGLGTLVATGTALGVLATTAQWDQHLQILALPAVLAVGAAAAATVDWVAVALASVVVVVGGAQVREIDALAAARQVPRPSEAADLLSSATPASYARVGSNDDGGHAHGLRDWRLACPQFHQYAFTPQPALDALLRCLPTADVVIVAPSLSSTELGQRWNAYRGRVEEVLARGFKCEPAAGGVICRRATP